MTPQEIFEELCNPSLGLNLDTAVELTDGLVRKQAILGLGGLAKGIGSAFQGLATVSAPLAYGALVGPPVLGYLGGEALAKAFDADDGDIAEIQERELIDELLHNAAAIRRRRELRTPAKK